MLPAIREPPEGFDIHAEGLSKCGLAGFIKKNGAQVDRSDLVRMLGVQSHRVSDGSGANGACEARAPVGAVAIDDGTL
jgi:hypothetical protein